LHRLNQNERGELLAEREAGIANLADEARAVGDETDDLVLAQAQFTEAGLNFGRGAQLPDAHRHAGLHPVQRTQIATRPRAAFVGRRFSTHKHLRPLSPAGVPPTTPILSFDAHLLTEDKFSSEFWGADAGGFGLRGLNRGFIVDGPYLIGFGPPAFGGG
jgi:hypothetical protein